MKNTNVGYKIRSKKTGLYSLGGGSYDESNFNDTGKTWKNIGHVKSHLNMYGEEETSNWEIVTFALVEIDKFDVADLRKLKK